MSPCGRAPPSSLTSVLGPDGVLPRLRALLAEAAGAAVAAVVVMVVHLRLWRAPWRAPWSIDGDASFYLMVVRSLERHGWYLDNPNLGWPFGQTVHDLPQGVDNLHLVVLRVLAALTPTPAAAINLFYVLTFAGTAFVAHLVLRRLGVGRLVSGIGAVVYTIAPYHWIRGETHLLLSGYELVPVGILLALAVLRDPVPLFRASGGSSGRGRLDLRSARTWWMLAACAGLASTGAYYFVFSMMLIAVAGVARAVGTGRWRPLAAAAGLIVAGGLVFAVNVSPTLLYQASHGANEVVAGRRPGETYLYGLKISQLFIPRQGHRVAKLAAFSDRSQGRGGLLAAFESESGQQLGLFAATGVALALVALTCRVAIGGARRRAAADDDERMTVVVQLGLFSVLCMIVGAMGGLSYIISSVGLRDIRSWNRISIVIAFCGVVVSCYVLDALMGWCRTRVGAGTGRAGVGRIVALAVAVVVGGVAYLDQAGQDLPDYAAVKARDAALGGFFGAVHQTLGDGAAVYMLPYNGFPETPARQRMGAYDQSVGYIYEPRLKYSWGYMRGRHPDYPYALAEQPGEQWLTAVAAVGFTGLTFDRFGYTDEQRTAQEADLQRLVGVPVAVSKDDRYLFYDLRAFAATMRSQLGDAGVIQRAAQTLALVPQNPPPGG